MMFLSGFPSRTIFRSLGVLLVLMSVGAHRLDAQGNTTATAPATAAKGTMTVTQPPCPPDSELTLTEVPPVISISMGSPGASGNGGPIKDLFFYSPTQRSRLNIRNDAEGSGTKCQPNVTGLYVQVRIKGFPVVDIDDDDFVLKPGTSKTIPLQQRIWDQIDFHHLANKYMESNAMGGLEVEITFWTEGQRDRILDRKKFYVYALYDNVDDNHRDAMIEFSDTRFHPDIKRSIRLEVATNGEQDIAPSLSLSQPQGNHFDMNDLASVGHTLIFRPSEAGQDLEAELEIRSPRGGEPVGRVVLRGDAENHMLFIDSNGLEATLKANSEWAFLNLPTQKTMLKLIKTEAQRKALVQSLLARIYALSQPIRNGFDLLNSNASAVFQRAIADKAVFVDHWTRTGARRANKEIKPLAASLASTSAGGYKGFIDYTSPGALNNLFTIRSNINRAEAAFRLTELLNERPDGVVDVYLPKFYNKGFETAQQFVNSLAKTIVHEFGHQVGAVHTGASVGQEAVITGINGRVVTLDVPPNYTKNNAVYGKGFKVKKDDEAFDITHSPKNSQSFTLSQSPSGILAPNDKIWIEGYLGLPGYSDSRTTGDIMRQGWDFGGDLILDISLPAYKLALGMHWTLTDADDALDYYLANSQRLKNSFDEDDDDPVDDANVEEVDPFDGPLLWVEQEDQGFVQTYNFEEFLIDSVDSPDLLQATFTIRNMGDSLLTVRPGELDDSEAFQVSGLDSVFGLQPRTSRDFQMAFHPATTGHYEAYLRIPGDSLGGTWELRLSGHAVSLYGDAELLLPNNNAGGHEIGDEPKTYIDFATIRNNGLSDLILNDIVIEQEDTSFTLLRLPEAITNGQGLILAPGEAITIDLAFTAHRTGLIPGVIAVYSNDPDTPVQRRSIVGTGLSQETAFHYGDDYVAMEFDANDVTLHAISDGAGMFQFTIPPQQPYHFILFDPVSGLVSHETDTSAEPNEPTQLSAPLYRASRESDTDDDFLPNDIELAIGSDPLASDTDGDGMSDYDALLVGLDPLGPQAVRLQTVPLGKPSDPNDTDTGQNDETLGKALAEDLVAVLEKDASFTSELAGGQANGLEGTFVFAIVGAEPNADAFLESVRSFFASRSTKIESVPIPTMVMINVSGVPLGDTTVDVTILLTDGSLMVELK
jgi:hypothetical protein